MEVGGKRKRPAAEIVAALRDLDKKTKRVFELCRGGDAEVSERYIQALNGNEKDPEVIKKRMNRLAADCALYLPEEEGTEVVIRFFDLNKKVLVTPGMVVNRDKLIRTFKRVRVDALEKIVAAGLIELNKCVRVF